MAHKERRTVLARISGRKRRIPVKIGEDVDNLLLDDNETDNYLIDDTNNDVRLLQDA